MRQSLARFSLLRFSRSFRHEGVAVLLLDLTDGNPVQVWIDPDWRQHVDARDQEYLSELIDQWKSTHPSELPSLWEELCRQSQGPLRIVDRGEASPSDRQILTKKLVEFSG